MNEQIYRLIHNAQCSNMFFFNLQNKVIVGHFNLVNQ